MARAGAGKNDDINRAEINRSNDKTRPFERDARAATGKDTLFSCEEK